MIRNSLIIFLILILFTECRTVNYVNKYALSQNHIIEGEGIDSFKVGKTIIDEVFKKLGNGYQKIVHNKYSTEIYYESLGISFYYYFEDTNKEVFCITLQAPFQGKTNKNISLNNSTLEEAIKIYGDPQWASCHNCDTWTAIYNGIEFAVERDKQLPQYPLDEGIHTKKKIIKIDIVENDN